jgi:hypothetical protein
MALLNGIGVDSIYGYSFRPESELHSDASLMSSTLLLISNTVRKLAIDQDQRKSFINIYTDFVGDSLALQKINDRE